MEAITFEAILSAIGSVGFPIVMCLGLIYFCYWMIKTNTEEGRKREEQLQEIINEQKEQMVSIQERTNEQMKEFSNTLNNFNETLIKIDGKVEVIEHKLR